MVIITHSFRDDKMNRLISLASRLRNANPTGSNNINFHSRDAHPWWRKNHESTIHEIYKILSEPLKASTKTQIVNARILIRKVKDISAGYINKQQLHVNITKLFRRGEEGFIQGIYYLDNPKITSPNGSIRNAPNSETGQLLLYNKSHNSPTLLVPKKGTAVYFTPDDTFHEVANRPHEVKGPVTRDMIIIQFFKSMNKQNKENVNQQKRLFGPFAPAVRVVAGLEKRSKAPGTRRVPTLEGLMSRLKLSEKRKRNSNVTLRNMGESSLKRRRTT